MNLLESSYKYIAKERRQPIRPQLRARASVAARQPWVASRLRQRSQCARHTFNSLSLAHTHTHTHINTHNHVNLCAQSFAFPRAGATVREEMVCTGSRLSLRPRQLSHSHLSSLSLSHTITLRMIVLPSRVALHTSSICHHFNVARPVGRALGRAQSSCSPRREDTLCSAHVPAFSL